MFNVLQGKSDTSKESTVDGEIFTVKIFFVVRKMMINDNYVYMLHCEIIVHDETFCNVIKHLNLLLLLTGSASNGKLGGARKQTYSLHLGDN